MRRKSPLCKGMGNCPVSTGVGMMLPIGHSSTHRSRADCWIHTGKAPSRKPWSMWLETRGRLSEQLIHKYLVGSGQSCLMATLGFSCGACPEVVLQTTLLSFSRTSSKFLCQLLCFLENSCPLLRSGLWTLLSPKLRTPTVL